jgi:hypothetical protein
MSEEELIERIRRVAWDPARRLSKVDVPITYMLARPEDPDTAHQRAQYARADPRVRGMVAVKAGSLTAVDFYRDAPREPARPAATPAQVDEAERLMGVRLPPLLRRLYTEVGDGWFGPAFGLPALFRDDEADEWPLVELRPEHAELGVALCDYGCGIWDFVSTEGPDHLVRCLEGDEVAALAAPGVPLVAWFEQWLAEIDPGA